MIIGFLTSIFILFIAQIIIMIFTRDDDLAIGLVGFIWLIYMIIDLFLVDGFFMKILALIVNVIKILIATVIFYSLISNKNSSHDQSINKSDDQVRNEYQNQDEEYHPEHMYEDQNKTKAANVNKFYETGNVLTVDEQFDFKNKIIQSNVKNTDYINKFGDMNKVMINATNNIAETDKMIQKYYDAQLKLPFDLDDYITFKNDLERAILNYWVQKRGYDGEKRALEDILNAIENTNHSYFYYHILTDVNVPFTYTSIINDEDTNNKDEVENEGSTQIDILVISNYGVYALEVKNYKANRISIEGVKTKNNNQRFERINGDLVPLAYIKRSFNDENKDDKLMDGNNMINHQTYLHEKAMVNFVADNLNMSNSDAKSIVYSTLVYANDGIDEYGKDKDGNKFFSGNNVEKIFKTQSGRYWKPFRTTAISSKGCFPWIMNYKNIDGPHNFNSLSNEDVDWLYELLEPYSGSDNEIAHSMYVFNESPEEFQKFIGRLYYLNQRMEKRLSNK
ncbi:nuclease-related domain-containing protein [Lactobacillaceae bacterium Scapto_B20]